MADHRDGQTVRMRIDGDELSFLVLDEGRSVQAGSLAPARTLLRHEPVTAVELEALIEEIEDRIMPVLRDLPLGAALEALTEDLGGVALALPGPDNSKSITRDEVEELFNRLADVASGSPLGSSGLPPTASFALGLVLLREVMHHGGFERVVLRP